MKHGFFIMAIGGMLGTSFLLAGCQSTGAGKQHQMATQTADHQVGCQKCYDEVKRVRKAIAGGQKWKSTQVIRKHMCPDCKVDMSTYTVDGKPMLKCAKCAPEGVACDRCLPPKAG